MYHILNYTRIKPRSRPPQKKSAYFRTPIFQGPKQEKKCANYASKYGNIQQHLCSPTSSNITRTCIVLTQLRKEVIAVYPNSATSCHYEQLHVHLMFSITFLKHVPMCQNIQQEYHTSKHSCITPCTKHQRLY